jgi:predicted transcriptional regulator
MNTLKEIPSLSALRADLLRFMAEGKLSQSDVVKATGLCQSVVSLFLSGKRGLSADAALCLLRLLMSSPCQAAFRHPEPESLEEVEK